MVMVLTEEQLTTRASENKGALCKAIDYVEFYVGNARQAAHFYRTAFGFKPTAYAGLETGVRDRVSFLLEQRNIRLVLTSPLGPDSPIAEHIKLHGDSIKDIALTVDDVVDAFQTAVERGATPVAEPQVIETDNGWTAKATIAACGDTVHSLIQRNGKEGASLPDFQPLMDAPPAEPIGVAAIDHVAISVEPGQMDYWADTYNRVLGFHQSHEERVLTEYSAMNSKVVQNSTGLIKFTILEPGEGKRKSQIEEYLQSHQGPGAQHVALLTGDIARAVRALRANGIEFLRAPRTYYEMLEDRIGKLDEDIEELRENNILVDRDAWGHLMQVFTKPLQSRPTVFLEVIQRRGARGFGSGNIKALFQALEREQALRGNL